jgi:pre-mRNA-processing factor 40
LLILDSQFVSGGPTNYQDQYQPRQHRDRDDNYRPSDRNERQSGYGAAIPSSDEPDYASIEEAEAVFFKLLKRSNIEADSTWEDTIRAAAKDKDWRAIKDPKDRKAAYEKYIADVRAQEKEREKERQAKLRSDFTSMLRTHPEITYYTRWRTAKPIIEGETLYRTAKNDEERVALFNEYRSDLYKAHLEEDAANRKSALEDLREILNSLDLEPYARWADTQKMIQANEQFQGDEKFKSIPKIEILKTFENHVRSLEKSFNDRRQKEKNIKQRTERQRRDQFINLLEELRNSKQWKLGMKWKDLRPIIEKDPRYVQMLGQEGSTPLEFFWDLVEKDEDILRKKRNDVLDVLDVSHKRSQGFLFSSFG